MEKYRNDNMYTRTQWHQHISIVLTNDMEFDKNIYTSIKSMFLLKYNKMIDNFKEIHAHTWIMENKKA